MRTLHVQVTLLCLLSGLSNSTFLREKRLSYTSSTILMTKTGPPGRREANVMFDTVVLWLYQGLWKVHCPHYNICVIWNSWSIVVTLIFWPRSSNILRLKVSIIRVLPYVSPVFTTIYHQVEGVLLRLRQFSESWVIGFSIKYSFIDLMSDLLMITDGVWLNHLRLLRLLKID